MSSLKTRIEKMEGRIRPSHVLVAIARPGETSEQALERTAPAWKRPAESFHTRVVLNFHGNRCAI
ncbi:hypothetical protein [Thiobaca trueperi]|uniref:Uncharacterized protein n=1 Tax=Thiobaca trueperi TaxID=127458 RepID=A0A4R3MWK3_9GAMM|nr:hypothetical protein [Thiobaca trueperi]TCT20635.1 hypothetical protein EDC35_10574 [Thiobaca trueperi]